MQNSQFITDLSATHLEGKWWKLKEPLVYYSQLDNSTIIVPPNFVTDFASVPRFPLAYLIAGNTAHKESAIHDKGYRWGATSRSTEDNIFYEAMRLRSSQRLNQNNFFKFGRFIRNNIMYATVALFGSFSYKNRPGCLDYRFCNNENCITESCQYYYPNWRKTYKKGFHPNILDEL